MWSLAIAQVMFNGMLATADGQEQPAPRAGGVERQTAGRRCRTCQRSPIWLPGFLTGSFQGLFAAAKTPPDIINRLNAEFGKARRTRDARTSMSQAPNRARCRSRSSSFNEGRRQQGAQLAKETGIKIGPDPARWQSPKSRHNQRRRRALLASQSTVAPDAATTLPTSRFRRR